MLWTKQLCLMKTTVKTWGMSLVTLKKNLKPLKNTEFLIFILKVIHDEEAETGIGETSVLKIEI